MNDNTIDDNFDWDGFAEKQVALATKTIDKAVEAQEDWDSMVEATIDHQIFAENL